MNRACIAAAGVVLASASLAHAQEAAAEGAAPGAQSGTGVVDGAAVGATAGSTVGSTAGSTVGSTVGAEPAKGLLPVPDYSGELFERSFLSGDWKGSRTRLAERGVQFGVSWTQHVQSVVAGGADTATRYGGSVDYTAKLDLQRLVSMPGALVSFRAESRYADSINNKTGSLLPANTDMLFPLTDDPDDGIPFAITELMYIQYLSETFALSLGKLTTLDGDLNEFASGRGTRQFSNANFIFNPVTALAVPYSTLGVGAVWVPTSHVGVSGVLMNTNDASTTTGFDDIGEGWTASVEASFKYTLGSLPGGQNVGVIYAADNDFTKVNGIFQFEPGEGLSIATESETWSVYWSGWQYVWVREASEAPINLLNGVPDREGFGLFARVGVADEETLPVGLTLSGGVGGRGLIPGRGDDHFGVGYFWTDIEQDRLTQTEAVGDSTQGVETFYNIALTPAAGLTLSVQAIEGAAESRDTAWVMGARLHVEF